jgi:hypothetical protein
MGYFKNLKFGKDKDGESNTSFGLFDNSDIPVGDLLKLIEGDFRTEGTFATTNPSVLLKPLMVTTKAGATKRYKQGFLPPSFLSKQIVDKNLGKGKINEYSWNDGNAWIGHLLNSHIESDHYVQFVKSFVSVDTKQKLEEFTGDNKVESEAYSARDYYLRFNDQRTDYFRHGLHIDGYTNLKSGKNARESWDGSGDSFRLASFKNTPYENNDPVTYGFELVIDAISSPLLNGAVEDFISQFSYVSEIASRAIVLDDFKRQFTKIFRTKGQFNNKAVYTPDDVLINKQRDGQVMASNTNGLLSTYANTDTKSPKLYRSGKKAYMSYYLQKIDGLSKLIESNTSDTKKFLTDYNKDVIKLTFLEDVSATMGTLAHLYKLLYWSKPNGKGLIPENLLRFNCDIIVSECRNFNRVRKATKTGDLEIIKDNVSRYIYQLRECQFYFNTMPHEDSIDMGNIKTYGEGQGAYEVTFDYKYSSTKFEKWVPDAERFGQYVGYHNGAIWKIGNKGMREVRKNEKFVNIDTSVPRFYTIGTNTMRGNGVTSAIILDAFKVSPETDGDEAKMVTGSSGDETPATIPVAPVKNSDVGEDEEAKGSKKEERKKKHKEALDKFKDASKNAATNLAKGAASFVFSEVNNQINLRANLLENTINKARNLLGMGGITGTPKRVYPRPYTPHSFGIYFDVRNELFNFVGEEVAGIIGGAMQTLLPGTQLTVPFKMPDVGATLKKITGKFSVYDAEARLIAKMKSKGPKKPFFDDTKKVFSNTVKTLSLVYNENTKFKYPMTTENVKYGGGLGVLALSYMKSKGTIYTGINNPATMINGYSKPLYNKNIIGTTDFSEIAFPMEGQKYPAPLIKGSNTLKQTLLLNSIWGYPVSDTGLMSSIQFPIYTQKYPAPISYGSTPLNKIVESGTIWSFPVNNKKFGK